MSLMEKTGTPLGSYAPDFELPAIDDSVHHLSRYLETCRCVAVVFMCNHCSYVRLYLDRLKQIQAEFHDRGFTVIGINSNDASQYPEDSFENMKKFATQEDLNFPYLWDPTQDVAFCFGAHKTPEAFLIDNQGILLYRGGIDDNAQDPEAVKDRYLREAIASLMEGSAVTPRATETIGGSLKWRQ